MTTSIMIVPPNSLIFISDIEGGETPVITRGGGGIWSTPSCVAVACLMFMDGETEIVLGRSGDLSQNDTPAFDGMIDTPQKKLTVSTSELDILLTAEVPAAQTRVRVWTNRSREPDHVAIGFD